MGMLPTPTVMEDRRIPNQDLNRTKKIQSNLNAYTIAQMLPTLAARDYKGYRTLTNGQNITKKGQKMGLQLEQTARIINGTPDAIGKTSQLNPRFVAEMMGFPPNWTELPFLNGEENQSKDTVTQ